MSEPHERMLLVVGWAAGTDPFRLQARVSVDMACELPAEPITVEEMQSVAFAAKSALAKVLRNRVRNRAASHRDPESPTSAVSDPK